MKTAFILAGLALGLCAPAAAFNHLTGEDVIFLGKDGRKTVGGMEYSVSRQGLNRYSTGVYAELTYGFWDKLDMMVTVPWHGWNSRGISQSGLGDIPIEAKFQVAQKGDWLFALKPGFSLPAGNEAKSLGAGKGGVWLYGVAGRTAGPWQFWLNGGYLLNRNSNEERVGILKASAAALLEVLPRFQATAQLAAASNTDKSSLSHPVSAVLGLVWSPSAILSLDAGLRLGLSRAAEDYGLLGGITLRI
jgi:hypothetical protein